MISHLFIALALIFFTAIMSRRTLIDKISSTKIWLALSVSFVLSFVGLVLLEYFKEGYFNPPFEAIFTISFFYMLVAFIPSYIYRKPYLPKKEKQRMEKSIQGFGETESKGADL